jgi:hypothetical protein
MNRIFLITSICALFLISFSLALNFGVSPEKIEFLGKSNQMLCRNFSIFGDNQSVFQGNIRWSRNFSDSILDYNLTSSELKIDCNFPEVISPGKYEVCLSTKNIGIYNGILMYKLENSPYGIAIRIKLEINPSNQISFLSGKEIQEINATPLSFILILSSIILAAIFCILIFKLKQKNFQ